MRRTEEDQMAGRAESLSRRTERLEELTDGIRNLQNPNLGVTWNDLLSLSIDGN